VVFGDVNTELQDHPRLELLRLARFPPCAEPPVIKISGIRWEEEEKEEGEGERKRRKRRGGSVRSRFGVWGRRDIL